MTQLLYVTTDELGRRTVSVVTVLQPLDAPASAALRLVSYQTAYDALGARCDPSYQLPVVLHSMTQHQVEPIPVALRYVAAGYTVVISDYEGEDLALGAGQQSGFETLDGIRAAETWLGAPESSTPVGMVGYSGGSVATDFAAELAHSYAPRLDIVGVAEGGVPVDPFDVLAYVDHPGSGWTWVIPTHFVGAARSFRLHDPDKYLTPQGIAVVKADQTRCVGDFIGLTIEELFKPQYRDVTHVPVLVRMLDRSIMGRTGTPRAPLYIGNGRSDPIGDGVTVTGDVEELAYEYCQRGVPVELRIDTGLDHHQAAGPFLTRAQAFLTQRFDHVPFQTACHDIGPGNSIAPVPVPAPPRG